MTQFNATETLQSIVKEFFQVDDEVRISVRGLGRLAGISHTAAQKYVARHGITTIIVNRATGQVSKPLETAHTNDDGVTTKTISLVDAASIIYYYAAEATQVSPETKQQAGSVTKAFLTRGLESWVRDVLGMQVDTTSTDADINALVGIYPGLANLAEQQTETMQAYISVRQYLTEVRGYDDESDDFKWMFQRLCLMGSQSYQSLKQTKPVKRLVYIAKADMLVKQSTYLYSELPILDMAYEKLLLAYQDYQTFLKLDWVWMDGE